MNMRESLQEAIDQSLELLPKLAGLGEPLTRLGEAMMACWENRGKVLLAGNGGSMSDAMHFAEELSVRFKKNRRALAAIALSDPSVITCAGNDFGYATIFERQVEALGQAGDILIVLSTSGGSENLVRAVELAKRQGLSTVAFIGKDGGRLRGQCGIELLVPSMETARIQEAHKLMFHTVCDWIDSRV